MGLLTKSYDEDYISSQQPQSIVPEDYKPVSEEDFTFEKAEDSLILEQTDRFLDINNKLSS